MQSQEDCNGCQRHVLTVPRTLLIMPCIWGHYWDAGASPMSSTLIHVTKTMLGVPIASMPLSPGCSLPSWGGWSCRGSHASSPAVCQNPHTAKSLEMCLRLRSSRLQLGLFMAGGTGHDIAWAADGVPVCAVNIGLHGPA